MKVGLTMIDFHARTKKKIVSKHGSEDLSFCSL